MGQAGTSIKHFFGSRPVGKARDLLNAWEAQSLPSAYLVFNYRKQTTHLEVPCKHKATLNQCTVVAEGELERERPGHPAKRLWSLSTGRRQTPVHSRLGWVPAPGPRPRVAACAGRSQTVAPGSSFPTSNER